MKPTATPQVINGKAVYQSGAVLPTVGSAEYKLAQFDPSKLVSYKTSNPSYNFTSAQIPTTVTKDSLSPTSGLNFPTPQTGTPDTTPVVAPPATGTGDTTQTSQTGVTVDANGYVTAPTNQNNQDIKDTLKSYLDQLKGEGDVRAKLQNDSGLATKTQNATDTYNAYNAAKLGLQQGIENMNDTFQGSVEGKNQAIADYARKGNANLANLAIIAQAAQGNLDATNKIIDDKIHAQFDPIDKYISYAKDYLQMNPDLSPVDVLNINNKIKQADEYKQTMTSAQTEAYQAAAKNGAPASVLTAIGDATSPEAVYKALGGYATNEIDQKIKQAQLDKLNADIRKTNKETSATGAPIITNPDAIKYSGALSTILGSAKFTKDQKQSVIDAVNSGDDAFSVIKNNAKNIMTQSSATKTESYERALDEVNNLDSLLTDFYANGGTTGIFNGNYEKVINNLGSVSDPKLVTLATAISSSIQAYRNAVSGTAYSVQEGKDINSTFPGINKSEGLNKAILRGKIGAIQTDIDSAYRGVLGSTTYDSLKKSSTVQTPQPVQPVAKDGDTHTFNGINYKLINGTWTPQ